MNDEWELDEAEEEEVEEEVNGSPIRMRRRPDREKRGNWYLLTGAIIGLALGLIYAWAVSPVKFVNTEPSSLASESKDEYRRVIALAYQADHNLDRARERMRLLDKSGAIPALASQAQRMLAGNKPSQEARALAVLAADLGKSPSAGSAAPPVVAANASQPTTVAGTEVVQPTPLATLAVGEAIFTPTLPPPTVTPTITITARPSLTPRPTATQAPTLSAPFVLQNKRSVCDNSIPTGLLQIQVSGRDGKPLPGIPARIEWGDNQSSTFYTGLAPEIGPGYADFDMSAGVVYRLQVGDASKAVEGLKSEPNCGWILEFTQSGSD